MSSNAQWPGSWVGCWVAADGKVVTIAQEGDAITVTVRPGFEQPAYTSAPLLDGTAKPIERIAVDCHTGRHGVLFLEAEAGTPELGPTYRLYAVMETADGWRAADHDVPADQLVLLPNTIIGLYDDFDDDLGVPWAYPLLPLRQRLLAEIALSPVVSTDIQ